MHTYINYIQNNYIYIMDLNAANCAPMFLSHYTPSDCSDLSKLNTFFMNKASNLHVITMS